MRLSHLIVVLTWISFASVVATAGDTCAPPPAPGTICTGDCLDPGEQCVPTEILADANGQFLEVTCCECGPPTCHVDVDPATLEISCAEVCPDPPGFTCTLIPQGNLDGTITYVCACLDPLLPVACEPVSVCNPCTPGTCTQKCPGPCPDPTDVCVPTVIHEDPPPFQAFTLTGCDCDPECRPIINAVGVVECIDQCDDGVSLCPDVVATPNPGGGVDYTCPPCSSLAVCDEPVGQTWCADLQATECESDDPLACVASCVHVAADGLITGVACGCQDLGECHVALGPAGPICEGVCPPGKTCAPSITPDGMGGETFCCDCVGCGPDPDSPTGCTDVDCPVPLEECLPTCVFDDGTGVFTALDCDCRGLEDCHIDLSGAGGPVCTGDCPDGEECVQTITSDGMGGNTICCNCECPAPNDCCDPPPPPATECVGICDDDTLECIPTEILADANGNFIAVTCCECEAPECHVDVDASLEIFCKETCPDPPPGTICTLLAKGNIDGTITYACDCIHPGDPHDCEPVSECNPCLPGTCTTRCPGPCPDVDDPCLPTMITEFPSGSGNFILTGCDCDPICRPIVNAMGVVECIDQCLDGVTPCPPPIITPDGAGGDEYTCPPCTDPSVCPEPTGQTLCADADLQDTDCESDDPLACLPTCIRIDDLTGIITAISCACATLEDCHVNTTADPPFCDGVCPAGETCVETIEDDGAGGQVFCCECLPCGPDPGSATGCRDVICPNPQDICFPTCVNDDGMGNFTALDCECRSAEECHAVINPAIGVECVNACPDGTKCVRTETPDGMGGTDICCVCETGCGPGGCCAGRPDLTPLLTGRVAVATASPSVLGGFVVTVYDMSKGVLDNAPFNMDFPIVRYNDPTWTSATLGSVFGITLDPAGNIYVTASTSYGSDIQGNCTGWGGVYRINGSTGAVTCFADLPNTSTPPVGLGNISYDCEHNQFFVTNFDDGKIYRLDTSGNTLSTYDHGVPNDPNDVYAPLGDRPWGVEAHRGRVYYGVWSQDIGRPIGAGPNEIWSVPLDGSGEFDTGASLEITLPPLAGQIYSNPVSDIRFTPKDGRMLLAERTMGNDTQPSAHRARVLEYHCDGTLWLPSASVFEIGIINTETNCAGGVDIDYKPNGRVWATGDALQFSPNTIYGIQGLPATGGDVTNSYLIDYQGNINAQDKTQIGDVVVNCPPCVEPPDDMVAWWPFDEVGGPIAVDIIGSHHGTHMNGPVPEPSGIVDGALRFDGVDDFVEVPDATTLDFLGTGAFSIDLWMHHDAPSGGLVGKLDPNTFAGFQFLLSGGVPTLLLETTQVACVVDANFGLVSGWYHLAVTVTPCPRTVTLYVNGQVAVTGPSGCCDIGNSAPLVIGSDALFAPFFEGVIDEVELFDRVLTPAEIWDIYQAGANGKCKGCRPKPDLSNCLPLSCPGQFDNCLARDVIYDTNLQQVFVRRCDCGLPNIWHVELDLAPGEIPFCTGDCPKGAVCEEDSVENPNGTIEITCTVVDVVLPPTVTPVGTRYLEVIPAAGESAVALLVTSDDEPCVSLYVQAPETINGHVIGRLGANPVLLTPALWGTVNVSDEAILPGTIYGVQTELADATLSGPATATTWLWADANNSRGDIDIDDILCILEGFADNYAGACSFFGADLEGGLTNVIIDFDDVVAALDAFAGDGYFDNPAHVDPCP